MPHHPSTSDCQYTLEQSHFPQIAPIELLMVILGSPPGECVHVCVSLCVGPVAFNSHRATLCFP